jgi:2-polyprenyl-3-methyl-5-hydroxy-6-metoxy-1,4-benzoquinol methylase
VNPKAPLKAETDVDRRWTQLQDAFAARDLHQMRRAARYTDWLVGLIRPHCGRRLLEVGAGIGTISRPLLRTVDYLCALEPNPACFEALHQTLHAEARAECRRWRIEDCDAAFIASRRIDTIVCVNVLEHIEDDREALGRLCSMLPPTGRLVLIVPAVSAVYGPIDAALGHHRRYTPAALETTLADAGLDSVLVRYSNLIGLLGWWYNARVARRVEQSDAQIRVFDRLIVPWWSRLERLIPPPVGLSLVCVAKPRGAQ